MKARHTVCTCPVLAPNARQCTCDLVSSVTCSGLDYVSHDDVLPYTNTSSDVFQHELFGQFFTPTLSQTSEKMSPSPLSPSSRTHTHCKLCTLRCFTGSCLFKTIPLISAYVHHQQGTVCSPYPHSYLTPPPTPQKIRLCLLVMSCSIGETRTSSAWP